MQTAIHKIRRLKDVGSQLLVEVDFRWFGLVGVCLLCFGLAISLVSINNQLRELKAEAAALNEKLGHRFAYVTADMDSAKMQIRGISDGLERLNKNAAKVVQYLENKDKVKNARQK